MKTEDDRRYTPAQTDSGIRNETKQCAISACSLRFRLFDSIYYYYFRSARCRCVRWEWNACIRANNLVAEYHTRSTWHHTHNTHKTPSCFLLFDFRRRHSPARSSSSSKFSVCINDGERWRVTQYETIAAVPLYSTVYAMFIAKGFTSQVSWYALRSLRIKIVKKKEERMRDERRNRRVAQHRDDRNRIAK